MSAGPCVFSEVPTYSGQMGSTPFAFRVATKVRLAAAKLACPLLSLWTRQRFALGVDPARTEQGLSSRFPRVLFILHPTTR